MIRSWRIVSARSAKSAFDGEGARLYGGRWNFPGKPAIYVAGSRALAALETLVHMSPGIAARQKFIRFEVRIPKSLVNQLDKAPSTYPPFVGAETQATGTGWLDTANGLALRVPSAVIPEEHNYLLNPAHPQFNEIKIGKPEPFAFDSRLIEK